MTNNIQSIVDFKNLIEYLQILNKHIPLKCRTRKDLYRWRKPWMNKNILQQIKTKNNLFQKFLKSRDKENLQKYKL